MHYQFQKLEDDFKGAMHLACSSDTLADRDQANLLAKAPFSS